MTFAVRLSANAQRDFYRAQAYYDAEHPELQERGLGPLSIQMACFGRRRSRRPRGRSVER